MSNKTTELPDAPATSEPEVLCRGYAGLVGQDNPMTKEQSNQFISATMIESQRKDGFKEMWDDIFELQAPGLQILVHRIGADNLRSSDVITPPALLLLNAFSAFSTPGLAVLWAFTILKLRADTAAPVTTSSLAIKFPMGFPDDAARSEAWSAQKGHNLLGPDSTVDNYLDTSEPWAQLWGLINAEKEVHEQATSASEH